MIVSAAAVKRPISNKYCDSRMTIGDNDRSFPAISNLTEKGYEAPASS